MLVEFLLVATVPVWLRRWWLSVALTGAIPPLIAATLGSLSSGS